MRTISTLALGLFALSACDTQPAGNTAAPPPTGPSEFQTQVAALAPAQRNAVFIRAIRDAGFDCQQVTASEAQPDLAGRDPLYTARCDGGASYGVLIGRDGTAQVVGAR